MRRKVEIRKLVGAAGGYAMAIYAAGLATTAACAAAALWLAGNRPGPLLPLLALGALAFMGERRSIRITAALELSVSFLPLVFAAVLFGPLSAMFVGAVGLLSQLGRPYIRWLVWTSSKALVGGAAGVGAWSIAGPGTAQFKVLLAATAVATTAEVITDLVLNSATGRVRGTISIREVLRSQTPVLVAAVPLYTPLIAILVYAYRQASPWSVFLFLIPAFAAQRLFLLYRDQRQTSDELVVANARLEQANLSFATALVATLDARDRYTAGHSAAVAIYARDIAGRMGLPDYQRQLVHVAGLVHDIGKVGLPGGLLEKTGPLTLEERRQMEQHSVIGERILRNVEDYAEIAEIVRHHHERVDGLGYPDGLHGDVIPMLSRIIAVADAYDAMISDRPYRDAMPSRVARLRLAQAVDSQFDTSVVAAFEAILAGASVGYRTGRRGDFDLEAQEGAVDYETIRAAG